jgi:hypothetical protein
MSTADRPCSCAAIRVAPVPENGSSTNHRLNRAYGQGRYALIGPRGVRVVYVGGPLLPVRASCFFATRGPDPGGDPSGLSADVGKICYLRSRWKVGRAQELHPLAALDVVAVSIANLL